MAYTATALPNRPLAPNEDLRPERHSALVLHNVTVWGHRTSIVLEPGVWDALVEICRREFCTPHDVCSYVAERKPQKGSLTSSLRVFILGYFRTASTEDGHSGAGHGQGMFLSRPQQRLLMSKLKADAQSPNNPDGSDRSPQRGGSAPGYFGQRHNHE